MSVYDIITQRIIDSLEDGVVPWRTPWKSVAPRNLISNKPYRGVNVFLLSAMRHTSPYWLTFRQAKGKGGTVKKGEKGTPVIFWKGAKDEDGERFSRPPILRYYTVFNLDQCEGIEAPVSEEGEQLTFEPIEACEQIVRGYATCPTIEVGGDQACYKPSFDRLHMPPKETFHDEESYYATLFHEFIHSTGAKDRLDREGISHFDYFGSHQYSLEELIAECGSAFLCGEAGIVDHTIENSAAYIEGWVKKLQRETKWIVQAGGKAAKAADYILGRDRQPATTEDSESFSITEEEL